MPQRFILESLRTEEELCEYFKGDSCDIKMIFTRLFELKYFELGKHIIKMTKIYTFKEMCDFIVFLSSNSNLIEEYLEEYINELLQKEFSCDLENYKYLKSIAMLVKYKRRFTQQLNTLKYFKNMLKVVNEHLIYLNMDVLIHKLEGKEYSHEKFNFLRKCIELKYGKEIKISEVNTVYKDILCGMRLKTPEEIEETVTFKNEDFEYKNKELWLKIIKEDSVELNEDFMILLLKYAYKFNVKNNYIDIETYDYVSLCSNVFRIAGKYEDKKINKMGATVKEIKNDEIIIEEEKKEEVVKRKSTFALERNKNKYLYSEFKINRVDETFDIRKEEYDRMIKEQQIELAEEQSIMNKRKILVGELLEELNKNLANKRQKALEERIQKEREEDLRRKEEAEKQQWLYQHKSGGFKSTDLFGYKAFPQSNDENMKKAQEMHNFLEGGIDVDSLLKMREMLDSNTPTETKEIKKKRLSWKDTPSNPFGKHKNSNDKHK